MNIKDSDTRFLGIPATSSAKWIRKSYSKQEQEHILVRTARQGLLIPIAMFKHRCAGETYQLGLTLLIYY
jgi:hypothetical protein